MTNAMNRRPLARTVFAPIVVYVTGMLALAVFVSHPPLLGWIGLAVISVIALLIGVGVLTLFPRTRTNAERLHPRENGTYRLLVVMDVDGDDAELCSAVRLRMIGRPPRCA